MVGLWCGWMVRSVNGGSETGMVEGAKGMGAHRRGSRLLFSDLERHTVMAWRPTAPDSARTESSVLVEPGGKRRATDSSPLGPYGEPCRSL